MHMALKVHRWTRADLVSLPDDGNRYEVLAGKLFVTPLPSPRHQIIADRLMDALKPYLRDHRLGTAFGPGAVTFGDSELQPDVVVFDVMPDRAPERWDQLSHPRLVVEVLSATTRRRDLQDKRAAYQQLGIPEYWALDRVERCALCWTPGRMEPLVERTALRWQPLPDLDPLVIDLATVFP